MHVFSKRSFLCRHIAGICSIFITGFLPGIYSKFLAGFLPKFLVQIPGRIPTNLNVSLQIPQGVNTDSCRYLYKKNQRVKVIPARNFVSFSCGNRHFSLLNVNAAGACGYGFLCDGGRLVRAYVRLRRGAI